MSHAILITGSRAHTNRKLIRSVLEWYVAEPGGAIVIHGNARGADSIADEEAKKLGLATLAVPANWNEHGKAAGPIRNGSMVDLLVMFKREGYDCFVHAFPLKNSIGTHNCIRQAIGAGFRVDIHTSEGFEHK
jgi:hypothetical protein